MSKMVNLPNGKQGIFPDDMSWDDIQSVLQKQFPVKNEDNKKELPAKEDNRSLLEKSGDIAQKYINEPVQNYVQGAGDFTMGAAQGLANIGPGTYNLAAKGANLIPGVNVKEKKSYDFAPHNINAGLGELASFFGPGILGKASGVSQIPEHLSRIPQIANVLKRSSEIVGKSPAAIQKILKGLGSDTAKSIGTNALTGAVMSPDDQGLGALLGAGGATSGELMGIDNKLLSLLGRSALGAGSGYILGGKEGAETGAGIAALGPKVSKLLGHGEGKPGQNALQGINYDEVIHSVEAGKRLGTNLTPAEASGNPFVGGIEGGYSRTRNAAFENVNQGMQRSKNEKKSINEFLNTIYDKSISSNNKIRELYKQSYQWNLKPEILNKLKEDPIIEDAINEVGKDKAWQRKLKGTSENNYAYLDKVRKYISDKEESLKKSGEKSKAKEYTDARHSLVDVMDESVPIYKKAREEAEKSIIRSKIEQKLKKSDVGGSEFYKKIIQNDNDFNKTLKSLRNVPKAQEQLKDMKQAWHSLINIEKPNKTAYQSKSAIDQARGKLNEAIQVWEELTGSTKNLEAVKYIRGDKWINDVKEINNIKNKSDKEKKLSSLFGKLFPGSIAGIKQGKEND